MDAVLTQLANAYAHAQQIDTLAELLQVLNWQTYVATDPLVSGLVLALLIAAAVWLAAFTTGNYSWVDKAWSLLPVMYAWHFGLHDWFREGIMPNPRLLTMAVLATLWGVRLTYNFGRKGGYTWHGEDYRWPFLRERMPWIVFQIFNVVFIALYQNILIYMFTLPAYVAWHAGLSVPFNWIDYGATVLFLAALLLETMADEQQWAFQSEKYHRIKRKLELDGDYKRGFLTQGLFRYSRHPNFFAEQTIWFAFYFFAVAATGEWLNWSIVGAVLLALLFQGSTWFTEYITLTKYPEYVEYQRTTSRLVPWFPSPSSKKKKTQ